MMRSIKIIKSAERKLSRVALLKCFKSRQIKAQVTENPAGCHEKGDKIARPFSGILHYHDLEQTRMKKMKGE